MPKTGRTGKKMENDSLILTRPKEGTAEVALSELDKYLEECRKIYFHHFEYQPLSLSPSSQYYITPDPSICITLKTRWSIVKPTKSFCEGSLLPLMKILEINLYVTTLKLDGAAIDSTQKPAAGNGNSNARILGHVLKNNSVISTVDVSNTGLDDEGITEISQDSSITLMNLSTIRTALPCNKSVTTLNVSRNRFSMDGVVALEQGLEKNSSISFLDVSRNALSYTCIKHLQHCCKRREQLTGIHCELNICGNYLFEEILNSVTHGIGCLAALFGTALLMAQAMKEDKTYYHFYGSVVFCLSLNFLFLASTLYHSFFMIPKMNFILRIADHCGIFLLIAGSYTPFLLVCLHHSIIGQILLCLEWTTAFIGCCVSVCLDLLTNTAMWIQLVLYILMGLAIIVMIEEVYGSMHPNAFRLLAAGGVAYLGGIPCFLIGEKVPIFHVIWHLAVMAGSLLHFLSVYLYVVHHPIPSSDLGSCYQ